MTGMFGKKAGPAASLLAVMLCATACQKEPGKIVVPDVFRVKFTTSQGDFTVEATKAWAPRGIDRFHELIRIRYFDEARFFRVIPGFIAQFGVNKDYDVHDKWRKYFIVDDPMKDQKNTRGTLSRSRSPVPTRARRKSSSTWAITKCSTNKASSPSRRWWTAWT